MNEKMPVPCQHCHGTGLKAGIECRECKGKGYRLLIGDQPTALVARPGRLKHRRGKPATRKRRPS
jgi:hypothetical protein